MLTGYNNTYLLLSTSSAICFTWYKTYKTVLFRRQVRWSCCNKFRCIHTLQAVYNTQPNSKKNFRYLNKVQYIALSREQSANLSLRRAKSVENPLRPILQLIKDRLYKNLFFCYCCYTLCIFKVFNDDCFFYSRVLDKLLDYEINVFSELTSIEINIMRLINKECTLSREEDKSWA